MSTDQQRRQLRTLVSPDEMATSQGSVRKFQENSSYHTDSIFRTRQPTTPGQLCINPKFLCLNDVYICKDRNLMSTFRRISTLLSGATVSLECNSIYFPFAELLLEMGAHSEFSIKSLVTALLKMSRDKRYYEEVVLFIAKYDIIFMISQVGTGLNLLTSSGYETFHSVYRLIENSLRSRIGMKPVEENPTSVVDWHTRTDLFEQIPDMKSILVSQSNIHFPCFFFKTFNK